MISNEAVELNRSFRLDMKEAGVFTLPVNEVRAIWDEFGDSIPHYSPDVTVAPVDAGGVDAEWVAMPDAGETRVLLHFHGGGYVIGRPKSYRNFNARMSESAAARVLAVDYRLAPEHPFPAAVEDTLGAYRWILSEGFDPRQVGFVGESAGGGLVFATLLAARDQGIPLPGAAIAVSPWIDLANGGRSHVSNRDADPMIGPGALDQWAALYRDQTDVNAPLVSPLFGDPDGLPPTYILVGGTEVLLDDSREMFTKLSTAGVNVTIEVAPEMPHIWPIFAYRLPEGRSSIRRMGAFFKQYLE